MCIYNVELVYAPKQKPNIFFNNNNKNQIYSNRTTSIFKFWATRTRLF